MADWRISRRTMLRGAGAAVSLPLLDIMEAAPVRGASMPAEAVRAAYLYIPNGVADGAWNADTVDGTGRIEKLNRWMAPLDPYKSELGPAAQAVDASR